MFSALPACGDKINVNFFITNFLALFLYLNVNVRV
jgi:hypothetical protein